MKKCGDTCYRVDSDICCHVCFHNNNCDHVCSTFEQRKIWEDCPDKNDEDYKVMGG